MRNLLFGVILGLLAVVHSTPVSTVTQIPIIAEDEFIREAVTDGFLIDHLFLTSLTTESPKKSTTFQPSQQPSSESKESDIEGSGAVDSDQPMTSAFSHEVEHHSTTTVSVSHARSSTSTVLPGDTDDSSSESSATQSPQFGFTSSPVPNETPDHISTSHTTDAIVSTSSETVSANANHQHHTISFSTTSSSNTETSTASSTSTAAPVSRTSALFEDPEGSGSGSESRSGSGSGSGSELESRSGLKSRSGLESASRSGLGSGFGSSSGMEEDGSTQSAQQVEHAPHNVGQSTPGWIVIVGFIVGVAALVMLCVAIATRDKWNGPKQASQPEIKTNASNQQRELEMETFLYKDKPRENGKAAEYTVIPLDELPEKDASH